MRDGLDHFEPDAFKVRLNAGQQDDGGARDYAIVSAAISLKRIADALDSSDSGGKPQGSVLWWLENIALAIDNASRS